MPRPRARAPSANVRQTLPKLTQARECRWIKAARATTGLVRRPFAENSDESGAPRGGVERRVLAASGADVSVGDAPVQLGLRLFAAGLLFLGLGVLPLFLGDLAQGDLVAIPAVDV